MYIYCLLLLLNVCRGRSIFLTVFFFSPCCCLNVCAEESKPFPWQTPTMKPIPARMNDVIVYLVKISGSHPSSPHLCLRITANSPGFAELLYHSCLPLLSSFTVWVFFSSFPFFCKGPDGLCGDHPTLSL